LLTAYCKLELTLPLSPTFAEDALRLSAAAILGMGLGLTRDISGKPAGLRTMGLVCLGSALITLTGVRGFASMGAEAESRVIQGVIQGVLTGVGFIGAGAVLHGAGDRKVRGLTTAAIVWVAAALGVACGLAEWSLVAVTAALAFIVIVALHPIEKKIERHGQHSDDAGPADG
jgi:putative Mg2+ transporter-C (MgtC) family protein